MEGRDLDDTEISAIEVASTPARGDTYGLGETIEVEVTFNQDADVTDPANTFASLFVGPGSAFNQWRRLQYHSGSGSDTLSFRYTVAANDNDPDGVTIGYTVGRDQDVTYIVTRGTDKAVDPYFGGGNVNAGSQHQVDGRIVPTISSVELTSNPNDDDREGDDDTYAIGDVIEATVTFDREVTVDVTNGKPTLELDVGGTPVLAAYADGSESTELVFRYAVAEGLQDAGGIAIGANKLELNGGTIAGFADASLDHDAEADDAAHRVDGVRPTFVDAEVWPTDPPLVRMTFSETIGEVDDAGVSFSPGPVSATEADITGQTVAFRAPTLSRDATVTADLSSGAVKDVAGNPNAAASDNPVLRLNLPDAPTGLTATASSSTAISLVWTAPTNTGSAEITGYRIEHSPNGDDGWTDLVDDTESTAVTHEDTTGLTAGTTRYYRVSTITRVGTSLPSQVMSARTHSKPDAPTNLSWTPGDGQVTLNWDVNDGGSPITKIQYRQKEGHLSASFDNWADIPHSEEGGTNATSYAVPSLTNGVAYTYELQALNSAGTSDASDALSTRAGLPPSGTPNVTTTRLWTSSLTVADTTDAVNEGYSSQPMKGALSPGSFPYKGKRYQIFALYLDGLGALSFVVTNAVPFFDELPADCNVAPTKNWTLHVGDSAVDFADANAIFTDDCSWGTHDISWSDGDSFSLALSTTEPRAPRDLTADSGDATVTLNWSAPDSGVDTPAITAYHYRYKTDGEYGDWTAIDNSANATSYTVMGLMNDTPHTFQVAAENSAGLGFHSDEVTQTPRACTAPGAPTLDSVEPTGFGKLTLTWSPPTELGTCGAIDGYEYQVKRGTDGTYSTWTDIDNSAALTSYEITSGGLGEVHYFQLRATVGTSNGTESAEESGTAWAAIEVGLDVPSSVREDAGSVPVAVEAATPAGTGRPDFEFTVNVSTAADTAAHTTDYGSLSFGVTFKSGDFSEDPNTAGRFTARLTAVDGVPLAITIVDDELAEDDETFGFDSHIPHGTPAEFTAPDVTIEDDDHAPEIRTTELIVVVGQTAAGDLVATDADTDVDDLAWSLTGGADEALFTVSEQGAVSLKSPAPASVDMPNDANTDGIYSLTVEVTDGANTVSGVVELRLAVGNPPDAPTDLDANGRPGAVALAWRAPEDDGGVAIQRYEYRYRVGTGGGYGDWLRIPDSGVGGGNQTSFTVTDLFGVTAYTFEVRAVNAAAAGPASDPAATTTLAACSGGPGPEAATEDALRLEDGDACRGRLEVYHDERWGTVCDDRMGSNASRPDDGPNDAPALACRAMGYEGGRMVPRGTPGMSFTAAPDSRPIWLDDVYCPVGGTNHRDGGPLETLSDCRHTGWGLHNCSRDEDVWVECTGTYTGPVIMQSPVAVPMLSVAGAEATEGVDETLDFTVTLEPEAFETVTVDYATADGDAVKGDDYQETTGRLTFEPGDTSQTVSVPIVDDGVEDGGETFTLTLSDAVGATIASGKGTATGTINNDEAGEEAALTAAFVGMPSDHDGTAFTFRVQFSEDPAVSYKVLESAEDGAFEVGGGTITRSKRVNGQHDLREIYVEPSGVGDVTIELAGRRACGTAGAICTADGKVLSTTLTATVKGPAAPLTAQFVGMPPEHDGTKFTFRVQFSEDPAVSYKVLKSGAFEVTGGTITKAKRVNEQHDLREIHVVPSGVGDVTLTLAGDRACGTAGAICTSAGNGSKVLSGTLTATVLGPAAISVADARVEEADGATLDFVVSLSRAAIGTVTVNYATEGGDAEEDIDYVAAEGTLIFVEGDQEKTVSVQVINDSHDEDPETMTLHLSDATGAYIADGVATGTIENSDPLQKAWLARFGRTVASHVVDALETRLDGASQSFVRVGGYRLGGAPEVMDTVQRLAPDSSLWSQQDLADEASGHDVTARDLLLRSAFHLVANDAEGAVGPRLSAWGRVSTSSFDGREDRLSLDGTVTTATLGVDGVWKRWLTGLALAYSDADGSFSEAGTAGGDLASTLTSVHPYVAYAPTARVRLWGMLGHGSGALQLRPAGQRAMDTDLQMTMGAVGIRGALLEPPPGGGLALALRSDVLWVRTDSDAVAGAAGSLAAAQADVSRLRLVLEGSRPVALEAGGSFTPSLEVGVRRDDGDAETGSGVEVGGRLRYVSSWGLSIEAAVRGLLAHEAGDYREWGASGALRFDPGQRGLGLSASIVPVWGTAASGVSRLWGQPDAAALAADNALASAAGRLDAQLGYGLAALKGRGLLTPYARVAFTEGADQAWHLGARLALAESLNLSLEASRRARDGAAAAHEVALLASLGW